MEQSGSARGSRIPHSLTAMHLQIGTFSTDVELIIFDKDGTLVDIHAPWGQWAEDVAQQLASYIPPKELLQRIGWDAMMARIRPETPLAIATVDEMHAVLATILYEHGRGWTAATTAARTAMDVVPIVPAPAVCPLRPLFEYLQTNNVKIAVVTNDDRAGVVRDLEPAGVLPYIDMIIGGDAGIPIKPAPDAVFAVAAETGVPVVRTAVVGDSMADLLMGRAANVALTVGVLSGSGTAEVLRPHADVLLSSVCALLEH
jgi:phosphoglycolate phosphatase